MAISYSEQIAKVTSDQLERFVTLNRHQLAGHVGNLDFWVGEARHAFEVIDGYQERFRRLKAGQVEYVALHRPMEPPRRVADANLRDARRSVADATYRFLVRLCNDGLIHESQLRTLCGDLGIGVEQGDIRRKRD